MNVTNELKWRYSYIKIAFYVHIERPLDLFSNGGVYLWEVNAQFIFLVVFIVVTGFLRIERGGETERAKESTSTFFSLFL